MFIETYPLGYNIRFPFNLMLRNIIPRPLHFEFFKFFRDLHVLVKDTILFVTGDLLDGLQLKDHSNQLFFLLIQSYPKGCQLR
jgi:hypothetical protein